jgi:putative transcriptional regulator
MVRNIVQEYRIQKQMTQEELASEIGVSRQTVIALEKGNYVPSILLALKLAKVFKVPVETLFTLSKTK